MPDYMLYVRDATLARVAQIDDWQRLEFTLRFNGIGTWTIEMPPDSDAAALSLEDGAGLIVQRGGEVLLSGPRRGRKRLQRPEADTLTLSGTDDMAWLADRLAYPVPAGPPYSADEYHVLTGGAESVIRQYVAYNAGALALVARRIPGLSFASFGGLGSTVTGRARFDNLLDLIASLALQGGDLGVKLIQSGSSLVFSVYQPRDLTSSAIFSLELGNLQGFEYDERSAGANYVICGGEGEGTARTFAEDSDATSISRWVRIETFVDYRKTTDSGELADAIAEEIERQAARFTAKAEPIDTVGLSFVTHWQLGDRVTLIVDDIEIEAVIREIKIALTPDGGETVTPVLGSPGAGSENLLDMIVKSGALRPRVGLLERR